MNKDAKLIVVLLVVCCVCCLPRPDTAYGGQENWRLGMQAYTFKEFTFYEAVDKTRELGLRYIEAYPGQRLSKEKPDIRTNHNMGVQEKKEMLQKLHEARVKLINYGVVGLPNNEAECRKVFDFASEMGIETIVSEPPEDAFDLIEKLCDEYKINVAIHNHPKPSHYWNADTVLKVCKDRSKRIGACADSGHWFRSGLNPVEQLKKLEGRIISLHFKDLDQGHDVIWGTGKCDVKAMLTELGRQNFKGSFSIEYEHNWLNSMPEIAECIPYFERTTADLGQSDWQWIFNGKDLSGWDGDPRLWSVKDGVIRGETTKENPARGNTFIVWRGGKLKDFVLKIKFRIQNGNSGIQYRSKEMDKWRISGYQAEVENNPGKVGFLYHEAGRGWLVNVGDSMLIDKDGNKHVIGKVSDVEALKEAGYYKMQDWNEYTIIAEGNHLKHYLNGYPMIELVDNDRVTNPDDPKDRKGAAREGNLALQIHAGPPMVVEFKDIRIKPLKPKYGDTVVPFNGKDLNNWIVKGNKENSKWEVGTPAISPDDPKMLINRGGEGAMINLASRHGDSLDFYTEEKDFGDCRIEVEVMVPQGSNSGIYVMGEYEIQVLDSWGRDDAKMGNGDMGAIYGASPPKINASKEPGQWQKYVIDFIAPKFDASGKKVKNARFIEVELNGLPLHKDLEMKSQTPGSVAGREAPEGPLMFQGNHGPVAYRNIKIRPLK